MWRKTWTCSHFYGQILWASTTYISSLAAHHFWNPVMCEEWVKLVCALVSWNLVCCVTLRDPMFIVLLLCWQDTLLLRQSLSLLNGTISKMTSLALVILAELTIIGLQCSAIVFYTHTHTQYTTLLSSWGNLCGSSKQNIKKIHNLKITHTHTQLYCLHGGIHVAAVNKT